MEEKPSTYIFDYCLLYPGVCAGAYLNSRENMRLPDEIVSQLKRLSFINRSAGLELFDYKVISVTRGTYGNGVVFETFVIGFEDRPLGAGADQDFFRCNS